MWGGLALEDALDLSLDRLLNEWVNEFLHCRITLNFCILIYYSLFFYFINFYVLYRSLYIFTYLTFLYIIH
jgi:hypothetical protein